MTNTSIDISDRLDSPTVELYRSVDHATRETGCDYLVVGASARDLVLHYGYGMKVVRATEDVDFGVQVSDWDQFDALCQALYGYGFEKTARTHRLVSPAGILLDVVPFGGVADEHAVIAWPPDQDVVMNVHGFEDALRDALPVVLSHDPELRVSVTSTPGLALLKLIAWTDRAADLRRKDAQDLYQLARTYERLPHIDPHEDIAMLETYEYDVTQVGAHLLGRHTREIAAEKTCAYIETNFEAELDGQNFEKLIDESLTNWKSAREENARVLKAFTDGFNTREGA